MKNYIRDTPEGFTNTLSGRRVPKDDIVIQISGLIDSLQSSLDFVHAASVHPADKELVSSVQNKLWQLAAEVSYGKVGSLIKDPISEEDIKYVEEKIHSIGKPPKKFTRFTTPISLHLNESRTRARMLETSLTSVLRDNLIRSTAFKYVNRISDLFFMMAYVLEQDKSYHEIKKEKKLEL